MDLKTFVQEALTQIDEALEETSKKFTKYNYKYGRNAGGNPTIDFEIQVYTSEGTGIEGGAGIKVAGIQLGSKGEIKTNNHEQSKICFSVVRENTPQQDKIERNERFRNQEESYGEEL